MCLIVNKIMGGEMTFLTFDIRVKYDLDILSVRFFIYELILESFHMIPG